MTLHIRLLRLRARTSAGAYGITLPFDDGLTILRGSNTRGKSTCLMSILYGLGLEGMLSAKRDVPLPHALTAYLEDNEREIAVDESDVTLELVNGAGEILTVQRQIKGPLDNRLIRTWSSAAVTNKRETEGSTDYFVRDGGAAGRDAGFHRRLAEFLGWNMPTVARYDGGESKLYLECIFPLLFVEQKRGWLGLQARMPTYLGIRDMQARSVEFLLNLDAGSTFRYRDKLEAQYKQKEALWQSTRATVVAAAHHANGSVHNLPPSVSDQWPEMGPQLLVPDGDGWVLLRSQIDSHVLALQKLDATEIPLVGPSINRLNTELVEAENRLANLDAQAEHLEREIEIAAIEQSSAEGRLASLQRDLQRNQDAEKLKRFGSLAHLKVVKDRCPTCSQAISGKLGYDPPTSIMSLDSNIEFVKEMIETVEVVVRQAMRRREDYQRRIDVMNEDRRSLRAAIRRLKRSLVQDDRAPSIAEVEERIVLEQLVRRLRETYEIFEKAVTQFKSIHHELRALRTELSDSRSASLSGDDDRKLDRLQRSFVEQLKSYGLASLQNVRITIDRSTYRPKATDMPDLEFELSGSDLIRAIWAYYVALLETSREGQTNHPGLLVIDEPKQQGTSDEAVAAMLRRVIVSERFGQQVIVASSAEHEVLRQMLGDVKFHEKNLDGWALQKIPQYWEERIIRR